MFTSHDARMRRCVSCLAALLVATVHGLLSPNLLLAQFTDVTAEAGVVVLHDGDAVSTFHAYGTGAAWIDYDRDGDLDLYVTQRAGANLFFENQGDGTFVENAAALGVDDATHDGAALSVIDFDNDGWLDLYLGNSDNDVLLKNDQGAGFIDITESAFGTYDLGARTQSASWGDYDGNGYPDLYIANHRNLLGHDFDRQDLLFYNHGDGTFEDVSYLLGLEHLGGYAFIGSWSDFDDDGDLDLLLINDCLRQVTGNKLWRNDGGIAGTDWTFTEVSQSVGADQCENGMGVAVGDYNRDGWLDYFFTNNFAPVLLKNLGGTFIDAASQAGVDEAYVPGTNKHRQTWGANFIDYDLDGWLDLHVVSGALHDTVEENPQPNLLYRNNGDGTFADVSDSSGLQDTLRGRTSVHGDYDGDGDLDLYLVNYGGEARLYRNDQATGHHWLIVDLEGQASNRDGIGALLTLTLPDGTVQRYETRSGSSVGGGDDLGAYFGLGTHTSITSLHIRWPSGMVQTLTDLAADQRLVVLEEGVHVQVTPDVWPVEIDASGGAIDLDAALTNYTAASQTLDIWTTITTPTGSEIVRGPFNRSAEPGATLNFNIGQNIPSGGPAGTYSFRFSIGTFPDEVQGDGFGFEKLAAKGPMEHRVDDWAWRIIDVDAPEAVASVRLTEVYPNPFNPQTTLRYTLSAEGAVRLLVYDTLGRLVARLVDEVQPAGVHAAVFEAAHLPSGLYLARLEAGAVHQTQTLVLLR